MTAPSEPQPPQPGADEALIATWRAVVSDHSDLANARKVREATGAAIAAADLMEAGDAIADALAKCGVECAETKAQLASVHEEYTYCRKMLMDRTAEGQELRHAGGYPAFLLRRAERAEADNVSLRASLKDAQQDARRWLIEGKSPQSDAPQWFCAGRGGFHWTRDANTAIWFCRERDAKEFADWCCVSVWPDVLVTEHVFDAEIAALTNEEQEALDRSELAAIRSTGWGGYPDSPVMIAGRTETRAWWEARYSELVAMERSAAEAEREDRK